MRGELPRPGFGGTARPLALCLLLALSIALPALPLGTAATANASTEGPSEYQIKAAFLCSLAQFTFWPEDAFHNDAQPLRIVVVGRDPFGSILDNVAAAQDYAGRTLEIVRVTDLAHAPECHLLFWGGGADLSPEEAPLLARHGTVTVGESPSFTSQGGVIRLFVENNRVRLEVNTDTAAQAGLHFRSQLLSLARLVGKTQLEVNP